MARGAYVFVLDLVPYQEAWDLQRSLAGAVSQSAIPDMVVFVEHPPVLTLGRRTDEGALHVDEVRPLARAALGEVFDLSFEELPAEAGHGLWTQSIHGNLAARS